MWLLIIWSNDYRIWLWQHDGFSWQEVLTTGCCYGLKVGKKLERNHGMCAKGRMDLWAWGGRLSWANKYEMRTTVRLFMEKFLLILLQLCEVQCQSVIAPVGWGWIRSYFIKINQERAQMNPWILTLLPKRHFNLNFGANGAALQGLIGEDLCVSGCWLEWMGWIVVACPCQAIVHPPCVSMAFLSCWVFSKRKVKCLLFNLFTEKCTCWGENTVFNSFSCFLLIYYIVNLPNGNCLHYPCGRLPCRLQSWSPE